LCFNIDGNVLLVKPTYKPVWEIPGGVVERNESPKQCCQREVKEELGIEPQIGDLLVVDYNHHQGSKSESLMFIFDAGVLTEEEIESIRLAPGELSAFEFYSQESLPTQMTATLKQRVLAAWRQKFKYEHVYLEDQISA